MSYHPHDFDEGTNERIAFEPLATSPFSRRGDREPPLGRSPPVVAERFYRDAPLFR
ncbi:MAG: hypothetical protein ACLTDR_04440 [Adlercreutzia equolifaciens]